MAFKFVITLAFVAVASAGYIPPQPEHQYYQAPAEHTVPLAPSSGGHHLVAKKVEEYDPHPQYKFGYDVHDEITGDSKSHSETRDGDVVEGEYSLIDADGFKRIVHYTADAEHGFNAVVSRVPLHGAHNEAAHHDVKTVPATYAAPTVVKTAQPVVYSAPVNFHAHAPTVYAAPPSYKTPIQIAVAPASYNSPSSYYKSDDARTLLKNASPVSYSAPSYYKAVPISHAASPSASNDHSQESYSSLLSSGYHH
ncbi:cuticle protein 21-like [Episyrphus balteatus]|uniref:cuticle protein 21-like n=1 Tax=Episyrphus balteatus TaxID=286459 RepID=UPI0024855963|nr:cuticle protein 21-like [Episyrphus balteatus]